MAYALLGLLATSSTGYASESRHAIALERDLSGAKRKVPDYDGLPPPSTTAMDVALWVPRTLALPIHATLEHLVRRPLGAAVTWLERHRVPAKIRDRLTWGPRRASSLVPTALVDFGFRPSVGLYLSSDDWLYDGNSLRLHAATGGAGWYRLSASLRHHLARLATLEPIRTLELHFEAERRTDRLYFGTGPRSRFAQRARFAESFIDAHAATVLRPSRRSRIDAYLGVRRAEFGDEQSEVAEAVRRGFFAAPLGFDRGYVLARVGLRAALDTRKADSAPLARESDALDPPLTGLSVALRTELLGGRLGGTETDPARGLRLFRRVARIAGVIELWRGRGLASTTTLELIDGVAVDADVASRIPFTELASLGGARPLRGFFPGRLLGRSTASTTLEYRWPIWIWLDGIAHYGVGNAFGPSFQGLSIGTMRQSFGVGMRTRSRAEHGFELLVAGGTRTFDEGGAPESLRFVLGSQLDW